MIFGHSNNRVENPLDIGYVIPSTRVKFMHGVAEYCYQYYNRFECKHLSREEMYILAYNHDIGYLINDMGHADASSSLLSFNPIFKDLAMCHDDTPMQACAELHKELDTLPSELLLLWTAIYQVGEFDEQAGRVIGYEAKLLELKKHYGFKSREYQNAVKTISYLTNVSQKE